MASEKTRHVGHVWKISWSSREKDVDISTTPWPPIWVVIIFDASMFFRIYGTLMFVLHHQHLIPLSEYEPGLSQWTNETTWTLLRYQTSFSEYIYIYNNSPVPNSRISPFIPTQLPSFRDPNPPSSNKEIPGEGFRDHKAPVASKTPRL